VTSYVLKKEAFMLLIIYPQSEQELQHVRDLFRGLVAWSRVRHADTIHLIDKYFDKDTFETELRNLPGSYTPPTGNLLLALLDDQPAGCVGLRQLDSSTCEMKRMFVSEAHQRKGVGRALATRLIEDARAAGYQRMLLETSIKQLEAQHLYRGLGFKQIDPYHEVAEAFKGQGLYMEIKL